MSKISFVLRPANKQGESPISVKHTHKGSPFTKASKVSVPSQYFNLDTGKVSKLSHAPELNATISLVVGDMEKAARNLLGRGVEPNKAAMAQEYDAVVASRENLVKQAPIAVKKFDSLLEQLRAELADLEQKVIDQKALIVEYELIFGVHKGNLLSDYVESYMKKRSKTLRPNSLRLFKTVKDWIIEFRPTWKITEVTSDSLGEFRDYILGKGKRNLTVADIITKTKSVIYEYAKPLGIDIEDVRKFRLGFKKKQKPNVIYLTKPEISDLKALKLENEREDTIRTAFVFMCLTGLRYSDCFNINHDNIVDGEIKLSTIKTDTELTIPMTEDVRAIVESSLFPFKYVPASNFNKGIKAICKRVEIIAEQKEAVKTYKGAKITTIRKTKSDLITCHTGRRTAINLWLSSGINPVSIAEIVGHEGTDLIMTVYGSNKAGKEQIGKITL